MLSAVSLSESSSNWTVDLVSLNFGIELLMISSNSCRRLVMLADWIAFTFDSMVDNDLRVFARNVSISVDKVDNFPDTVDMSDLFLSMSEMVVVDNDSVVCLRVAISVRMVLISVDSRLSVRDMRVLTVADNSSSAVLVLLMSADTMLLVVDLSFVISFWRFANVSLFDAVRVLIVVRSDMMSLSIASVFSMSFFRIFAWV